MNNAILRLFSTTKTATPLSTAVTNGSFRLDAAFYSADSADAQATLSQSGARIETLKDIAEIHCSGVRERAFVDRAFGIPLLTGSTLDLTTDDDLKFVSKVLTRNIMSETLQTYDILVSSAGTVGKADFVHRNHEGRLASQDVIRIRPKSANPPPGYVFAFLTSPIAQRLIANQPAGSVIVRIYDENLERLTVPRLPSEIEVRIANMITAAFDARADAKALLAAADAKLLLCNHLPHLPDYGASRHSTEDEPDVITPSLRLLQSTGGADSAYRLDAHFYNPLAQLAISNLRTSSIDVKTVGEVAEARFTGGRPRRNYVDAEHGIRFLSGKNIVQIRPTDQKFLATINQAEIRDFQLEREWTLVTRCGTLARTCFVWHNFENCTASEHMVRVIPDRAKIDPAYLYAFLSCRYGYEQIMRYRHGSVIDVITDKQIEHVLVPCPSPKDQKVVGDMVRHAYEKRAEAIRLEDGAQAILMNELTKIEGVMGA